MSQTTKYVSVSGYDKCPRCGDEIIGVEYSLINPNYHDGVSEWTCSHCAWRVGRWTGNELEEGETEPPYGISKHIDMP